MSLTTGVTLASEFHIRWHQRVRQVDSASPVDQYQRRSFQFCREILSHWREQRYSNEPPPGRSWPTSLNSNGGSSSMRKLSGFRSACNTFACRRRFLQEESIHSAPHAQRPSHATCAASSRSTTSHQDRQWHLSTCSPR